MPAVVAEGLTKRFGDTEALRGIDFAAEPASVLGLLGPNGAGKTTAVRILATLIRPDRGRALVDGIDVVERPRDVRARIGLTGQYAAVDERLTGAENLTHIGRLFHLRVPEAKRRAAELLRQFALDEAADRPVRGYSGGMRRRLDIAMSLISRPAVLFLDEPTTGLDPRSRLAMWELIEELVQEGMTTVLTTQYLDEAERLADQIVVIDRGLVIAEGSADELKGQTGGDRVEITVDRPEDTGRVGALVHAHVASSSGEHVDEGTHTVSFPVRDSAGIVPVLVRLLDDGGVGVNDIVVRRPTLDDVFLDLTGHTATEADEDEDEDSGLMATVTELELTHDVPRGPIWLWRDSWTEALRHLRAVPRDPELLIFATIQPIMFVLLFSVVFGGSIEVPGYSDYDQYLLPGIFAQTVLFGSMFTGVGIAEDMSKGMIERLRSLPMYPSAVLIGRTISDTGRNVFTFIIMLVVAFAIGFRIEGTLGEALGATALLLGFGYAFAWISAFTGLSVKSVEVANSAGFIWMFPLTFVSSAFVATENMPSWLQPIADANPFTVVTNASRALYNGRSPGDALWQSIAWAVGITIVFAFLSARKFASVRR